MSRRSYEEAIASFDLAIEAYPEHAQSHYERGTCYIKIGNFMTGVLGLSKATGLDPDYANILYEKMYQISYVVDLGRVIGELDGIIATHPDEAHVVFMRGFFYLAKTDSKNRERDDVPKGITDLDSTIAIDPDHASAYAYRGILHSKNGDNEAAMADYDQALSRHEDFGMAHYFKSVAHATRGDLDATFEHLERAFATGFNGYERAKREEAFAPYRNDPRFSRLVGGR